MNNIPEYKQRINARKIMLEAEIEARQKQLQTDAQHFAATLPTTIKEEVLDEVKDTSPMVAKVLDLFQGSSVKKSKSRSSSRTEQKSLLPLKAGQNLLRLALPIIYTIGSQKVLSYSLRSAGKLVRFGLRLLFGIRKKRR